MIYRYWTPQTIMYKKIVMLLLLLTSLWMIDDFSVFKALEQHEPSNRIFRSLLEFTILLLGSSFSLYVWNNTIGNKLVAQLFFPHQYQHADASASRLYNTVPFHHDNNDNNNNTGVLEGSQVIDFVETDSATHGGGLHIRHPGEASTSSHSSHQEEDDDKKNLSPDHLTKSKAKNSDVIHNDHDHDDYLDDDSYDNDDDQHSGLHSDTTTPSVVPTPQAVLGAALNTLLLILVALFLFCWSAAASRRASKQSDASNSNLSMAARVAAPTFPLLLFCYFLIDMIVRRKRRAFWRVLGTTLGAPLFAVTFRDGFVGDVLTSSVRPLQDMVFTVVYLCYGLQGWWSQSYSFQEDGDTTAAVTSSTNTTSAIGGDTIAPQPIGSAVEVPLPVLEKSWILHTILLPLCVLAPLWWRYLQNLRQIHEEKQRWPYIGNAFKYLFAAQAASLGVYYPEWHTNPYYLTLFCLATLYQIWWDVVMDWGLLDRNGRLRKRRLYPYASVYWGIAGINCVLRFCWTLSFLPTRYLHPAGFMVQAQSKFFVSPIVASAEIIRRTLWGLLRFEYEAIKVSAPVLEPDDEEDGDHLELTPMKQMSGTVVTDGDGDEPLGGRIPTTTSMSSMSGAQVLGELGVYAGIFVTLLLVAAAHRKTM